jgi:hypothetical protein
VGPDSKSEELQRSNVGTQKSSTDWEVVQSQGRPLVSVLLPVYNGKPYLEAGLQSVLSQSYQHFEVIVIDDGSTDGSYELIQRAGDPRIRLFRQSNHGLPATLNRAIQLSRGDYLARQDQDDLAHPHRLEKQVAFLEGHPSHAMVGTWAEIWVGNADSGRRHEHPTENHILKWELLFNNPFVHSSIMLRKSAVQEVGGYCTDPSRQPPEDYELWSRLARQFELANLPECLQIYREVEKPFLTNLIRISSENIAWAAGQSEPDQVCASIAALANGTGERVEWRFRASPASHLLRAAAQRLGASSPTHQHQLKERAEGRLQALRHAYYASHPSAAHRSLNLAHSVVSRVLRKLTHT